MARRPVARPQAQARKHPLRERLVRLGETDPVASALAGLASVGEPTIQELTQFTGHTASTVKKSLHVLDKRKWLAQRRVGQGNRGAKPYAFRLTVSPAAMRRYYQGEWSKQWQAAEKALRRA